MPPPLMRLLLLAIFTLSSATGHSHSNRAAVETMSTTAQQWLDSLSDAQRKSTVFAFKDSERENWHFIPKSREGLSIGNMNDAQRKLARELLATGLSEEGLLKAEAIMALEGVLREMEKSDHRDRLRYFFTVFGTPTPQATWGWRFEGHHLSINFTIVDGDHISATPTFLGANPAEVRIAGPNQGKRALGEEEDLGRSLVLSLNAIQQKAAIIYDQAPRDILTSADKRVTPLEPIGLKYTAMSVSQQTSLQALVQFYANRLAPAVADAELKKIADAGWNHVSFAWAGSTHAGQGHYYRIQSPDFVIKYDNTQNGANHIHTVWRAFDGDFGRDLLQEHYQKSHK